MPRSLAQHPWPSGPLPSCSEGPFPPAGLLGLESPLTLSPIPTPTGGLISASQSLLPDAACSLAEDPSASSLPPPGSSALEPWAPTHVAAAAQLLKRDVHGELGQAAP